MEERLFLLVRRMVIMFFLGHVCTVSFGMHNLAVNHSSFAKCLVLITYKEYPVKGLMSDVALKLGPHS